jgi:hypothetical protein
MPPYVRANISGIDKTLAKLRSADPIYAQPWKRGLTALTEETEEAERQAAPKRTETLAGSVTSRMDARPVPEWGLVTATAVAENVDKKRGGKFRYGWALNAASRWGRKGRSITPNKGWWAKTFKRMQRRVNEVLGTIAKEIEAKWSR